MGLKVKRLSLTDWRNFDSKVVEFSGSTTILCGHNAVGKTNTVEALQLLTSGFSFRKARPAQLVHEGSEAGCIQARLEGDSRVIDLMCEIVDGKRHFFVNEKHCHAQDMPQTLMSVFFCPDDLSLVKRGASYRRAEIDSFGKGVAPSYARLHATYTRAVEQRNRLLKEGNVDLGLLDAWDSSVAYGGATLLDARMKLFGRLRPKVEQIYAQIAAGERLTCTYECTLGEEALTLDKDALCDLFLRRMHEGRADDLRRQQTLVGPQRDDLGFAIDGRDARAFGSQGQQRSIALAWKMAEVEVSREIVGQEPLLLLDDVMSELDEARREQVVSFVQEGIQTVITTTNLGYFSPELLEGAEVRMYDE